MKWLDLLDTRRIVLLIVLAGSLAYANSLGGQFVFDDTEQIVENPDIRSWSNLESAFTTHVWAFRANPRFLRVPVPSAYYRPIFTVILTTGYHIFGLWPQGWHLTSLALHLVCSIGVYLLLLRFSSNRAASAIAALLFAVYPIHAESVCWISGMTDPLFGTFFVFSFVLYLKHREGGKGWALWISLLLFALSLLSKEPAIGLVLLVFAYEMIRPDEARSPSRATLGPGGLARRLGFAALSALPFAGVVILYLVARYLALGALTWKNPAAHVGPFTDTLLTLPMVLVSYGGHLLWPVGLSFAYQTHSVTSPYSVEFLIPLLALAAGLLLMLSRRRISSEIWFALALILIPLLPVLDLKQLNEEYMVWDRYLYLPAMGFCYLVAMAVLGLPALLKQKAGRFRGWRLNGNVFRPVVVGTLLLLLILTAAGENRAWADSYSLWSKAARVRPGFWAAHYNVGLALLDSGRFADALGELERTAELGPGEPAVFDALGRDYRALGDRDRAISAFQRAVQLDQTFFESLNNLGTVYFDTGDYAKAEKCFLAALRVKPQALDSRYNLALAYVREGRYSESISEFESLVGASPEDAEAAYELGLAYAATGRSGDALVALRRSLGLAKSKEVSDKVSEALDRLQVSPTHP